MPGQPNPLVPQGAFVLPGDYEVRLSVDGRTERQPLRVDLDPRLRVAAKDLESLLAFQQEVEAVLGRSAELAEALRAAEARRREAMKTAVRDEDPARVNSVLSALAIDLESADAAPTEAQRQALAHFRAALARFEARWTEAPPAR